MVDFFCSRAPPLVSGADEEHIGFRGFHVDSLFHRTTSETIRKGPVDYYGETFRCILKSAITALHVASAFAAT